MTSSQCSRRYEYWIWVLCLMSFKRIVCLWENKSTVGQILILTILTFGKGSWPNDPDFRVCAATYSCCLLLDEVGIQHSSFLVSVQVAAFPNPGFSSCCLTSKVRSKKNNNLRHCPTFFDKHVTDSDNSSLSLSFYLLSNEMAAEFNVF